MNATTNFTTTQTTENTKRITVTEFRPMVARAGQPKPATVRLGGTVRRFMNALMQAMATPHI